MIPFDDLDLDKRLAVDGIVAKEVNGAVVHELKMASRDTSLEKLGRRLLLWDESMKANVTHTIDFGAMVAQLGGDGTVIEGAATVIENGQPPAVPPPAPKVEKPKPPWLVKLERDAAAKAARKAGAVAVSLPEHAAEAPP